mmetsp:Transcript_11484/g.39940  ORF Transcript_11484/g.39940 Transcript_11484/m.39940 type:complete len:82 (+) Transcript_11484:604-849(+)
MPQRRQLGTACRIHKRSAPPRPPRTPKQEMRKRRQRGWQKLDTSHLHVHHRLQDLRRKWTQHERGERTVPRHKANSLALSS